MAQEELKEGDLVLVTALLGDAHYGTSYMPCVSEFHTFSRSTHGVRLLRVHRSTGGYQFSRFEVRRLTPDEEAAFRLCGALPAGAGRMSGFV